MQQMRPITNTAVLVKTYSYCNNYKPMKWVWHTWFCMSVLSAMFMRLFCILRACRASSIVSDITLEESLETVRYSEMRVGDISKDGRSSCCICMQGIVLWKYSLIVWEECIYWLLSTGWLCGEFSGDDVK